MQNEPLVLKRFGKALICVKNNENPFWVFLTEYKSRLDVDDSKYYNVGHIWKLINPFRSITRYFFWSRENTVCNARDYFSLNAWLTPYPPLFKHIHDWEMWLTRQWFILLFDMEINTALHERLRFEFEGVKDAKESSPQVRKPKCIVASFFCLFFLGQTFSVQNNKTGTVILVISM